MLDSPLQVDREVREGGNVQLKRGCDPKRGVDGAEVSKPLRTGLTEHFAQRRPKLDEVGARLGDEPIDGDGDRRWGEGGVDREAARLDVGDENERGEDEEKRGGEEPFAWAKASGGGSGRWRESA